MKNIESSIAFRTDVKCSSCKKGYVFEKFKLHIILLGDNGIIGPGSCFFKREEIEKIYFCENCGVFYEPTKINNLAKNSEKNYELAKEKFGTTDPFLLKRDLEETEVFEIMEDGSAKMLQDQEMLKSFKKDDILLFYSDKSGHFDYQDFLDKDYSFSSSAYIVPTKVGVEIRFWQKKFYEHKPLLKKEKQKISADYKKYQKEKEKANNKFFQENHMLKIEFKGMDGTKRIIEKMSKPLPKGSELARKIFSPIFLKDFYVPWDSF